MYSAGDLIYKNEEYYWVLYRTTDYYEVYVIDTSPLKIKNLITFTRTSVDSTNFKVTSIFRNFIK